MRRLLRTLLRTFYLTLAFAVILLAVVVQLGRSFTYLVSDYNEQLAALLSEQTGTRVALGALEGHWDGLQPLLDVDDIAVYGEQGELLIALEHARLRLDLLSSAIAFTPVWSNVTLNGGSMSLIEDETGRWRIRGTNSGDEAMAPQMQEKLVDILLAARRIGFERTQLDVRFQSGERLSLESPSLLLENRGDFHRLLLHLDVEERPNALFLLLESDGDPRLARSEIDGYLQLRKLPFSQTTFAESSVQGAVDASIWLHKPRGGEPYQMSGELALTDLSLPSPAGRLNVDQLRAELSGTLSGSQHWQIGTDSLFVALKGRSRGGLSLSIERDGSEAPMIARMAQLDLAWLSDWLLGAGVFAEGGRLEALVQDLNARGALTHVAVSVPPAEPRAWELRAQIADVSLDSWNRAPAFEHIHGYLQVGATQGQVQIDRQGPFAMIVEEVYDQPLNFDSASGQVAWLLRPEDNQVDVYSGPLTLSDGAERARGQFHLSLPFERNTGSIDLTIALAATDVRATQYRKYLPAIVPESLREYLDRGIGSDNPGRATRGSFVYRGSLNDQSALARSVGLDLTVTDGSFIYHDNWPRVHDLQGRLVIDDGDVHGRLRQGRVYNSRVYDARIAMTDNPSDEGRLLEVAGLVDGIASDGLRILRQSVLRQYVGSHMDSWYLHGELSAAIDLAIPLTEGSRGGHQKLAFDIDAETFALDNFRLELADFSGRVTYDNTSGIRSEKLRASMFGHPTTIALSSKQGADQENITVIDVRAQASAEQLAIWSRQPALLFAQGELPLDVHVELNHTSSAGKGASSDRRVAAVAVNADLADVAVDLPEPLGKVAGESGVLAANYILGAQTALVDVHYLDELRALLHLKGDSGELLNGSLSLGGEPELTLAPEFHIAGELEYLQPERWLDVIDRYRQQHESLGSDGEAAGLGGGQLDVPLSVDLVLARQPLGPVALTNLRLRARQLEGGWDFLFNNQAVSGELFWPADSAEPLRLSLAELDIPESLLPVENADEQIGGDFDAGRLAGWRAADVTIESLKLAGGDYGRWAFAFRPAADRLQLADIIGDIRGLRVAGQGEAPGANLTWLLSDINRTAFSGEVTTDDMAKVLRLWQAPPNIESDSAEYQLDLSWPGSPLEFDLVTLSGVMDTRLGRGRFIRDGSGAGEGLLRLMGLFNFDSLARRLRLDFSDLYKSGLTFDSITGTLVFDEGSLHIKNPIQMRSPSSRMQLTGSVDLVEQTLDTQLVATLPMAGNLTVIAALAAGLPAAAGVFVISKLFEEQMNKATSVSYRISGDWDDPVSEFQSAAEAGD